jgi:hypothetical protein
MGIRRTLRRQKSEIAIERAAKKLRSLEPLEVMLDNMRFWHDRTAEIERQLQSFATDTDDDDVRQEAMSLLRVYSYARVQSQTCAKDAAPYCHPRYVAVELKKEESREPETIEMELLAPNQGEDRSYRMINERPVATEEEEVS